MTNLRDLPNEILHNSFRHLDPLDIANLIYTCKFLHNNIASDSQLCKAMYYQIFVSKYLVSVVGVAVDGLGNNANNE